MEKWFSPVVLGELVQALVEGGVGEHTSSQKVGVESPCEGCGFGVVDPILIPDYERGSILTFAIAARDATEGWLTNLGRRLEARVDFSHCLRHFKDLLDAWELLMLFVQFTYLLRKHQGESADPLFAEMNAAFLVDGPTATAHLAAVGRSEQNRAL